MLYNLSCRVHINFRIYFSTMNKLYNEYIFSKCCFQRRECSLCYPSRSIVNFSLSSFKILSLLHYYYFSWVAATCQSIRIFPYLDCSFNLVMKQISKILFTIIGSICNYSFDILFSEALSTSFFNLLSSS